MEIDFVPGGMGEHDSGRRVARPATTGAEHSCDAALSGTETFEARLKQLPMIRPDRVRRAKKVLSDANYPPDEMLLGIADLLARQIN